MACYENESSELYEAVMTMNSDASWMFLAEAEEVVKLSFVNKLINKIIALKNTVVHRVQEFFTKRFSKNVEEELKSAISENPELKTKKVKVKNWKKVEEVRNQAQEEINRAKTTKDVDKAMNKYKKKRAAIIASTTLIAATTILGILHHKRKSGTGDLEKKGKAATKALEKAANKTGDASKDAVNTKIVQATSVLTCDGFRDYELEIAGYADVIVSEEFASTLNPKDSVSGRNWTSKGKDIKMWGKTSERNNINEYPINRYANAIKANMLHASSSESNILTMKEYKRKLVELRNKLATEKNPDEKEKIVSKMKKLNKEYTQRLQAGEKKMRK